MRFRLARPSLLVDINPIEELAYLRESDGALAVGATTRDFALETSKLIGDRYRLIADTSAVVADPVVRQMGTVVGSLCHNDPAGDWPATALASRAQIVVRGPKAARESIAIDDFLVDSYTTAVADGEIAVKCVFRRRARGRRARFKRSNARSATSRPPRRRSDRARRATERSPRPGSPSARSVQKRCGSPAAEQLLVVPSRARASIAAAMREAEKVADPCPDNRGSVEYKKSMAGVLVGRAIVQSFERLGVGDLK